MAAPHAWCFGPFRLDPGAQSLWRDDTLLPLPPKPLAVLAHLVTHAGEVVAKEALLDAVWPETAVTEGVLKTCLAQIRQVLGDTARRPQYIATLHRRGYRFVAPVVAHTAAIPGSAEAPPAATSNLPQHPERVVHLPVLSPPAAERRHLTVLCCDLIGAIALVGRRDPDAYREVLHTYYQVCAEVAQRFDGTIAPYLGDGVLVYFGYPVAHEDDAQRAVRAGLALLDALAAIPSHSCPPEEPVMVQLGVHTGLVVVDAVGMGARPEPLALGETPRIALRLPALAEPNTLVISTATHQLVAGYFRCKTLGVQTLQGLAQPLEVYRVLGLSGAQSRLAVAAQHGLTPLVGRTQDVTLLTERWMQVEEGLGQVVLLMGEAGIGKSRLAQGLKEHVANAGYVWLECQGSPYAQHTALYPLIELLTRHFLPNEPGTTAAQRVRHLEAFLAEQGLSPAETVPLLAPLLALSLPRIYAPAQGSPEQQRQQTLHTLVRLMLHLAAESPLLLIMEDLHWVDPSTLEWLSLLVDQGPTTQILTLCTARPDFRPPWTGRAHCTQLTLARLLARQAADLARQVAHGTTLPAEVVAQIVAQTDGVPLFVEEVTRTVLESGLLQAYEAHATRSGPLPPLAIPATLHDALLARLDRLGAARGLAQLGATLGREFAYPLLRAVAPEDEATLQQGLQQLVAAEFLYQRGLPPQATYVFKHALIQEAAYQSLLKRTRQMYHRQIAQALVAQFPAAVATQPEMVAHHYTEAGLRDEAADYWQQAGQQAISRAAHLEAVAHCRQGLAVLAALPITMERQHRELDLQIALGAALATTRGWADAGVAAAHTRARELCRTLGNMPRHFWSLRGLWNFYVGRGELRTARGLAEQMLALARQTGVPLLLALAYVSLGMTWHFLGAPTRARMYLGQGFALHDPAQHQAPTRLHDAQHAYVAGRSYMMYLLWVLGLPQQARALLQETLGQATVWAYPANTAFVLAFATILQQICRDLQATRTQAEALLELATAQGFPHWGAMATVLRGWSLVRHGQGEAGLEQIRHGLQVWKATGIVTATPYLLSLLADAQRTLGHREAARAALAEAQALVKTTGERWWEAELHRLTGELLLLQDDAPCQADVAEAYLQQALAVSHRQQAKALELRAATSLAHLWQQQGKRAEARALLAPIYAWFTEGFDTPDLQEARALLDALA